MINITTEIINQLAAKMKISLDSLMLFYEIADYQFNHMPERTKHAKQIVDEFLNSLYR